MTGHAEGAELIAIFTVLGLGLFGGGLFAIYEGWPYLVLERGFTQVIIGAVAASAGLIMLSLAWVLRELKVMRREFAQAAEYGRPDGAIPLAEPVAVIPPPVAAVGHPSLGLGLGAGAAALGAGAVTMAASRSDDPEKTPETAERDLFGSLVAERLSAEPSSEDEPPAQHEPGVEKPVADLFESGTEAQDPTENADATESAEPVEIVAAMVQPLSQDEALAKSDFAEEKPVATGFSYDDVRVADESARGYVLDVEPTSVPSWPADDDTIADEWDAAVALSPEPEPELETLLGTERRQPQPEAEVDEFSALRDSLTSQLGGVSHAGEPAEDSASEPFAIREDWLSPISGRREPSFGPEEPVIEPVPTETQPSWPPRAATPTFYEQHIDQGAREAIPQQPEHAAVFEEPEQEPAEVQQEPVADAPEEPASSNEGIVGAYQVGDAHFTIFADGSIRARTPDGEYSFASMDELKVYLVSEKSRLGV